MAKIATSFFSECWRHSLAEWLMSMTQVFSHEMIWHPGPSMDAVGHFVSWRKVCMPPLSKICQYGQFRFS